MLLLAFLPAAPMAAQAQKKVDYHLISLNEGDIAAQPYAFYVENVYDGRQFRDNIGTVQKGALNRKVLARLAKPLEEEIKQYLDLALPKLPASKPISIRINDLFISEFSDRTTETGFASVTADVIEVRDGTPYIVGTYAATIEGSGMDVTGKHAQRIRQAIIKCIAKYEVTPEEDKLLMAFDPAAAPERNVVAKPAKGVYSSFTDLLRNKPAADTRVEIRQDNEKYYLVRRSDGRRENNYFAYSDGENFYLNVSRYATTNYYAKAELIGDKYFVNDVIYNPLNLQTLSLMYGAMGIAVSMATGPETYVPMLIDSNSGQPIFLSAAEIKTLLAPKPELLQEYKKGNKTREELKRILTRFYGDK